jgi:hypothetical protein
LDTHRPLIAFGVGRHKTTLILRLSFVFLDADALIPIFRLDTTGNMKFAAFALVSLIASVEAFVPQQQGARAPSKLQEEAKAALFTPAETVPCFGATPMLTGEPVFFGENYWNELTTTYGSEDTGAFLCAAELKHGRSAMVATCGFAFQKTGITFDKISPHEYLSVTENVKFADLAAMSPVEAVKLVPSAGWAQVFATIAAIEIYELTHRDGEIKVGEAIAPGLQSGGLTGR